MIIQRDNNNNDIRATWRRTADEVIRAYADVSRLPTSRGERQVAVALVERLRHLGYRAGVEAVPATGSYALPIGLLSAAGLGAGIVAAKGSAGARENRGKRKPQWGAALVASCAAAAIADDVTGGSHWFRRAVMAQRRAYNVVAYGGDPTATRTAVVLAHHDAAPSGLIFDQRGTRWAAQRFPRLLAAIKTSPPLWWPVILGPALVAFGSISGKKWLRRSGMLLSATSLAAMIDIGRRPAVPGANDNLSGVAALICIAEALQRKPIRGLRVLFVSAGAEEALQEGIRGFARRHFAGFGDQTWFINLESVGSGRLALLEGEGPLRMHDYPQPFREFVAACAQEHDIPLLRGLRSRNSTDSDVPRRHGFPVATIVSLDHHKLVTHYHLDTDVPDNVDLDSVVAAAELGEAVIRKLAASPPSTGRLVNHHQSWTVPSTRRLTGR